MKKEAPIVYVDARKNKYKIQNLISSVYSKNDNRKIQILICMTKGEEMVTWHCIDQRFKPSHSLRSDKKVLKNA